MVGLQRFGLRQPVLVASIFFASLIAAACSSSGGGGGGSKDDDASNKVFTTFQEASIVIGQANFAGAEPALSATRLSSPYGHVTVHDGVLFVPDFSNNRVLGFDAIPTENGAAADFVIGQSDLVSNNEGTSNTALDSPEGVTANDDGIMAVMDYGNNRVLVYSSVPSSNLPAASVVAGQAGMNTTVTGCAADSVSGPEDMFLAGGKLLVADRLNHRVLVWNSVPESNGSSASRVIGQEDFVTCSSDPAGSDTLSSPTGVWSDGTRLIVADQGNHRVLIWNTFPSTGDAADIVLGQPDMTSSDLALGADGMNGPTGVASDGTILAVSDMGNDRVLIWNTFPEENGQAADVVLGQKDFDLGESNDDDGDGTGDGVPTAQTLASPWGVFLLGDQLFVTDNVNDRVLIFEKQETGE